VNPERVEGDPMSADLLKASLEDLYEDAPCGYIFTLPDGRFARVNQTFLSWTGYTRDALADKRFQDLLTVPGRIFYENQYAPLLRMQERVKGVSFDLRRQDGSRIPVLVNSMLRLDGEGQPIVIASTVFDATDRERYERELRGARERAEHLAAIVTSASDAIVRASLEGTIETWNAGAERLFGYSQAEGVGRSIWDLFTSTQREASRESILQNLHAGRPVYLDGTVRTAGGQEVDVSLGFMPHLGFLGELVALSVIMRDISDRRALERLQQEFLALTSHELRHPLTAIKGQAQLMRRRGSYSERAVDTVLEQADRLGRLIDDLLLASLIEADRFDIQREELDLVREVALAVGQSQQDEHPIHLKLESDSLPLSGDRQRLGQVFANLLSNAMKYSPAGRPITVQVSASKDSASVAITDQGVGIAPEDVARLFTRFFRAQGASRNVQGLGLGLYITHRIVHAHGGSIDVQSEPGTGSTFTVTLPR
jgi:PAS domain S-box-containing protein